MKYNGWDIEYLESIDDYTAVFDNMMAKDPEGQTENLENAIAEYTGRKHCITMANATDALRFSLMGIGKGDEVLVTDFSWISTSSCISMVGATPVFCDIDILSYQMNFESIKRMASDKTKALIYTHLYGNMVDTTEIEQWCDSKGIRFIEDSAQSLGTSFNGRKAGTIGYASSYSFNANKVISGLCGGGVLMTDDDELGDYARKVRRHGKDKDFSLLGYNSKMYTGNADIILMRMGNMEKWQKRRNEIADIYDEMLGDDLSTPYRPHNLEHNFHKYVVMFDDKEQRKHVKNVVKSQGINLSIHYEKTLSNNSLYSDIEYRKDDCGTAQLAANTVMSLPIHAWLEDEEVENLCNIILMS
jgi:dTDP-4-amino-4,6-dideoxygalactose transaminase